MERVPYLLVVGGKEVDDGTIAVRTRRGEDLGSMFLDDFAEFLRADIAGRGSTCLEE